LAKNKLSKASMQSAIRWLLLVAVLLASCQKRVPDFNFTIPSPQDGSAVSINGFQARGTIEGSVILSFRNGGDADRNVATFHEIRNGMIGWTSKAEFAVVADHLTFPRVSSDYYPDGTVHTRMRLVTCARDEMDCSSLEARIIKETAKHIARFPASWID
jgi:hypothetical protein